MKTQSEIEALWAEAIDQQDKGTKFPGMSYEDGIVFTIDWILDCAPYPLADEE